MKVTTLAHALKRIAELKAENAKLRGALQEIADSTHLGNSWARYRAKAALPGGEE